MLVRHCDKCEKNIEESDYEKIDIELCVDCAKAYHKWFKE